MAPRDMGFEDALAAASDAQPIGGLHAEIGAAFTLQLLHAADQEAAIPALSDIPNFSAVLNALRAQDVGADGTLLLSSGDAYIPGVFASASVDAFGGVFRGDILIQNLLGFQAIAFGNHEFDLGTAVVADLVGGGAGFAGASFPYLAANLDVTSDPNLAPLVVAGGQAPLPNSITTSVVIEAGGAPIGVIGAVTPTLRTISSPGAVTVSPSPFGGVPTDAELDALAAIIQAEADALTAANDGLNKIILLAHMQQLGVELALAERLSGVDIIVGGGSNTRLFDENDRVRDGDTDQGPYPIFKVGSDGAPVAVVNTDGNYKYLGRLVLDFDADGVLIPESYDAAISGAYATDAQGVADLGAEGMADPEILAIVDALRDVIVAQDGNFFGITEVFLNGDRNSVRRQETNLGNLTADANLWAARQVEPGVVVSIKNGGGVRNSIGEVIVPPGAVEPEFAPPFGNELAGRPEGGISQPAIQNALSFNNGLSILTASRAELVALLEHGVAGSDPAQAGTPGRFPQVSGVAFAFDLTREPGARILSAAIVDEAGAVLDPLVRDGALLGDPDAEIRLVTLNFLANGGDAYPFRTGEAAARVNLYVGSDTEFDPAAPRSGVAQFAPDGTEQDALAEYLDAFFSETPFAEADTGRDGDTRIQNLAFRDDTVFEGFDFGGAPAPVLNEFVFDHRGADTAEYVEIFGAPETDYSSLTVVVIEGDNNANQGRVIAEVAVGTTDADGFWVSDFFANVFQNGAQTMLLVSEWTGSMGQTLDLNRDGVLDVTPWSAVLDGVAVAAGASGELFYAAAVLAPGFDGDAFRVGGASRIPDGADTDTAADWVRNDFNQIGAAPTGATPAGVAVNTPGAANAVSDGPVPSFTLISAIQGAGDASPLVGQRVTVQAVLTQISPALRGFWLQEEDADQDDDPATSEGIFVFVGDAIADLALAVGDLVTLEGTVGEFFGLTQLSGVNLAAVTVESRGVALPEAVEIVLPLPDAVDPAAFYESVESMRVRVVGTEDAPLTVTNTFTRFGEVGVTGGAPLFQPTQVAPSFSDDSAAAAAANARNQLLFVNGQDASLSSAPRIGDGVDGGAIDGVMHFSFSNFKVQTDGAVGFDAAANPAPRQDAPDAVGGSLTVASFNVLNYFTTLGSRGAATEAALADQTAKIVAALGAIDADVVGLVEIENDLAGVDDEATAALVAALNAALGGEVYGFVSTGRTGTDDIRQAFIYKTATVSPTGDFALLEDAAFTDPLGTGRQLSRPALAQTFTEIASGESFTAVVNHLKSKGSPTGGVLDGEADDTVEEGSGALTRLLGAQALTDWLATDPTGAGDPDFLILGDINAYAMERAIKAIEAAGYVDLARHFGGEDVSSYQFRGQLGTLDYAFANEPLLAQVTGATIWTVNSPEAYSIQYDGRDFAALGDLSAFASSDHDPVIVGLQLSSRPAPVEIVGTEGADRLIGTDADEFIFIVGGNNVVTTGGGADVIFLGDSAFNGRRETTQITDYDPDFDVIDLGGATVASAVETRTQVILTLDGDGDRLIVRGVDSLDKIQFAPFEDLMG